MKTTMKILPLLFGVMLFFTQCEKEAIDKSNVNALLELKSNEGACVTQTLWAGAGQNDLSKGTAVGTVSATVVGDYLVVVYTLEEDGPWHLVEAHLWVGNDITKGNFRIPRNAAPGLFPFKKNSIYGKEWTQTIELESRGIGPNDPIYVAAHAVVAEGFYDFGGFEAALPNTVTFSVQYDDEENRMTYFKTTVSEGDPTNFLDRADPYPSYCINSGVSIRIGRNYTAAVYSSYNLPEDYSNVDLPENFPMVNWIINFIDVGDGYTYGDVQRAIWELLENDPTDDLADPPIPYDEGNVADIIAAAEAYQAENGLFFPVCGQDVVIVLDPLLNVQPVIIWKEYTCGGEETAWAEGDITFIDHNPRIANKWGWIFEVDCD